MSIELVKMPTIKVVQLDPDLPLPAYAMSGDAAMDLLARSDGVIASGGGRVLFGSGIAIALPPGWCALVLSRSGLAARHGVFVANAPGLVDSGYRGEIMIPLINTDPVAPFTVHRGDRIAQLLVMPVDTVQWSVVDELDRTDRGTGGLGHTGV
jgi:dUTP pyrophosphatase